MTVNTTAELSATGLRVEFTTRNGRVARALDGTDLVVRAGEVVALVGESGSGKTTLARSLVGPDQAGRRRDPLGGPGDEPVRARPQDACAATCSWCSRTRPAR